jgi:hypothetical protein
LIYTLRECKFWRQIVDEQKGLKEEGNEEIENKEFY